MDELNVSDPALLSTDIGPVIDAPARDALREHIDRIARHASWTHQSKLGANTDNGSFFAPRAFEIDSLSRLTHEVFGPVIHVVRFAGNKINEVVDAINNTGYGLTLGIHSRVDATVKEIVSRAKVGNIYVNRNIIGAVVGVQPFGGRGLSGTGPKAGGPHYLPRFTSEYTVSVNTSAVGGNASLLSLE
jgi:RHH-type proline utilization regulon transcriptional repressor/proline dehydrogenase/delta 1-pyrroline-5-carboxylate dehydrogenase